MAECTVPGFARRTISRKRTDAWSHHVLPRLMPASSPGRRNGAERTAPAECIDDANARQHFVRRRSGANDAEAEPRTVGAGSRQQEQANAGGMHATPMPRSSRNYEQPAAAPPKPRQAGSAHGRLPTRRRHRRGGWGPGQPDQARRDGGQPDPGPARATAHEQAGRRHSDARPNCRMADGDGIRPRTISGSRRDSTATTE